MYGPDITFLGVPPCDLAALPDADVVIIGAPFDGGTSHRPGTRFGPGAIRQACYLAHDGSRPSLALRVDPLQDLRVYDAGDVEMFSGDAAGSVAKLEDAVAARGAGPQSADSRTSMARVRVASSMTSGGRKRITLP
jgi:agmatinase